MTRGQVRERSTQLKNCARIPGKTFAVLFLMMQGFFASVSASEEAHTAETYKAPDFVKFPVTSIPFVEMQDVARKDFSDYIELTGKLVNPLDHAVCIPYRFFNPLIRHDFGSWEDGWANAVEFIGILLDKNGYEVRPMHEHRTRNLHLYIAIPPGEALNYVHYAGHGNHILFHHGKHRVLIAINAVDCARVPKDGWTSWLPMDLTKLLMRKTVMQDYAEYEPEIGKRFRGYDIKTRALTEQDLFPEGGVVFWYDTTATFTTKRSEEELKKGYQPATRSRFYPVHVLRESIEDFESGKLDELYPDN